MRPAQGKAAEVEMLAVGLPVGSSMRVVCPACQGGSSKERSLSISRLSDGLKWNCHRSSCTEKGITTGGAYARGLKPEERGYAHEVYTGSWHTLERADEEYFGLRFDLTRTHDIGWNDDGQYVSRIIDRHGQVRGYNVRRGGWSGEPSEPRKNATKGARPKTRTFLNSPTDPSLSVHRPEQFIASTLVLVEDQISAMKVAQAGFIGAALLGDGLNIGKVRELQLIAGVQMTLFAMDADATGRSFEMAQDWGLALPSARVLILERDLKDMPRDEVKELLWRFRT